MTTINNAYINALLADASYVDDLETGSLATNLEGRMTSAHAEFIAKNFKVLDQEDNNPGSSFDAIVWEGLPDTEYADQIYVSMRGTAGATDILNADVDLATSGVAHDQFKDNN